MSKETDQSNLIQEINEIKKEVKDISYKVDLMLEILNSFTIMLSEEEAEYDEENEDYDSDETWVPKEDDFWENDNDDESI